MAKFMDLTGEKYGRLTVIERIGTRGHHPLWRCVCDCGRETEVTTTNLRSGTSTSCGCYKRAVSGENLKTHGRSRTRLHNIWKGMRRRCNAETCKAYQSYGGRGIRGCPEWDSFEAFYQWAMGSGYNDMLSIDRIDVDGNYEPDNCRWVTDLTQANNKRNNRVLRYNGEEHTVSEWADILGIKKTTLFSRLNVAKWPVEKALSETVNTNYQR